MKYISLLLVCLLLASCSSDSSSKGSGSENNPTPQPAPTPQSLIARAWEAQDTSTDYLYRVELLKDGRILAHLSQIKSSPVLVLDKKKQFVQKHDANGYSIFHLTLWRETIDSTVNPNDLSNKKTLGAEFYKTLDLNSITVDSEEIITTKATLKVAPETMATYDMVMGSFKSQEDQWVFTPTQATALSLSYEQTDIYDYKVTLKYSLEEPNLFVRKVVYSRTKKETPALPWMSSVNTVEDFRNFYSSRTRNGYVTEFQIYKKVNDEYLPHSNVTALYLPAFQIDAKAFQWVLTLDPRSFGSYNAHLNLSLPIDVLPQSLPEVSGGELVFSGHAAAGLPLEISQEYIDKNTISYGFMDIIQGSKIIINVDLNKNTHRYFEPGVVSYQIPEVPFYYLNTSDLKFDCVKEGMSFKVSWKSPGAFEMKAVATSILSGETFVTQYSTKKTQHEIFVPGNADGLTSHLKITYKNPLTDEEKTISNEVYLSNICSDTK